MLDRKALEELFDYTEYTWAVFGNSVRALPPGDFTRAAPGSGWPSMRDASFHIAGAWDELFRERFNADLEILDSGALETWAQMDVYRTKIRALMRRTLDESSDDALRSEPANTTGRTEMTTGDLLTHVLLHDLRHHGDINTLLSQLGAEVPMSDYAVYVWFKNRKAAGAGGA
jgi:uncharacterized damage-inducible protein DinB